MTTDGPAALRRIAGEFELTKAACWNESDTVSMWALAAAWDAERQACQSAVEEADRLRFAAEAQAAADRAEIANCLENIRELAAQKRTSDAVIADVREELHIGPGISVVEEAGRVYAELSAIKQTIRPVPDSLLAEKNQQGEYSMKILPFDYAAYGVSGEPEHDTSGDPCWCGAEADSDGVVVHKDMIGILSDARFWGQGEAADDLAVTRAALAQAQEALSADREKWSFDTALAVGALLLAKVYPEDVFTGASGDDGPTYIVALRDALQTYSQRDALAQARALLARWKESADYDEVCIDELEQALGGAR